ncbi:MAG: membrane protein [Bacteroidia bacterium]|nr:MAG: membrane protein [Bacteroidia bacterium]
MNPFFKQIVIQTTILRERKNQKSKNIHTYSNYKIAKEYRKLIVSLKEYTKDFILIILGIFLASFGFKGFLLTNNFIDGGATGISLLINKTTQFPLQYSIVLINLPFVILGYYTIGLRFAIKTLFGIFGLSVCLAFVDFPDITKDNLLVAVFGGFFLGAGIGFTVRGGGVIDGTEILAIYLSRKLGTTIGDIITIINAIIFSIAAYFLGIENAMYSMITYLSASKTLDFIVDGLEEYISVFIVSRHHEEIRQMITLKLKKGVTVFYGRHGLYSSSEKKSTEILYTVITRLEINRLNMEIEKIDPNAFVTMSVIKDTKGGFLKKKNTYLK